MYKEIRKRMRTGDVIAFSGKGRTSNAIKFVTDSDISHVAIVYCTEDGRVMLMESTTLNDIPDCETGKFIKGVQKQYLSDRIKSYDGQVYWYRNSENIKRHNRDLMLEWLDDKHGKETAYDQKGAIMSGFDIFDPLGFVAEEDFSSLFCSELVCKALQIAEVVGIEKNASEQTPADVIKYPCLEQRIEIRLIDEC